MTKRIVKKIYKRCKDKFDEDRGIRSYSRLSYIEICSILTPLEKRVWMKEQKKMSFFVGEILKEFKKEEEVKNDKN